MGLIRRKDSGQAWETVVEGSSSESGLLVASRTLSSAELLDLDQTPIELIPAPGDGKAIFPPYIGAAFYHAGATPYTIVGGGGSELLTTFAGAAQNPGTWGPGDLHFINAAGLLDSATDVFASVLPDGSPFGPPVQADPADWMNLALVVTMLTGFSLTLGDGTLDLRIPYIIADFN